MPELGSQVLEVVLGLAFVYLVFSLICSALQELVATVFAWRAKNLEEGLRSMFQGLEEPDKDDELLDKIARQPRIQAMLSSKKLIGPETKLPDYLSARSFSAVLLDTIAPPAKGDSRDLFARLDDKLDDVPHESLRNDLRGMIEAADKKRDALREEIENWFDDTMNRASGWYRRKAQLWLVVFGMLIAAVGNVDTIAVVDRLWNDPNARAAIVAQAEGAVAAGDTEGLQEQVQDDLDALELPVGWTTSGDQTFPGGIDPLKILGIILSGLAISLGAPFWFDALSKVSRLRPTGKPEGRAPGTANP
ncbi:MAG: hypothetical protein ACRDPC_04350 [Solirubrobacteraceae bacterium]